MNPLISIITPNYNAQKFVSETIQSVLNQTYQNWELIIVDDCSTDNSLQIINSFVVLDKRMSLLKLTKNSGPAVARNKAIEFSKGDYIAFLDSDDRWFSTKLEKQLTFMQQQDIALSFTSYNSYDEERQDEKVLESRAKVTYKNLLTNNYIGCLTAMYSVSKLGKVFMPVIAKRQDWALWLKITKMDVIAYGMPEILASYTRRNTSVSSSKWKLLKYNWKIYREFEKLNISSSLFYFLQLFIKKLFK